MTGKRSSGAATTNPTLDGMSRIAFCAHFAEVAVDTRTGLVRVIRYLAVHDSGQIISPMTAESQVQGGVHMGLGQALFEEMDWEPITGRPYKTGYHFGETAEIFAECYGVEPAEMAPGVYRSMTGNRALAWGILAAAQRTGLPVRVMRSRVCQARPSICQGIATLPPSSSFSERPRVRSSSAFAAALGSNRGRSACGPAFRTSSRMTPVRLSWHFVTASGGPWITTCPPPALVLRKWLVCAPATAGESARPATSATRERESRLLVELTPLPAG